MPSPGKPLQTFLPWDSPDLEALLRDFVAHGTEAAKVDRKLDIETGTPDQKAELLKDVSAIANTYDEVFKDHGFLIYGVQGKVIIGITSTESNTDKFQNHIEQLLKTYISPMPQVYVVAFETTTGKKWGAIAIPPRNSKPHMFFKDLQCVDQKRTRKKGEWFVRRGATTDPGLPEDLALITQRQTELLLEPLRESVRALQARVAKTEEQYNHALFRLVERAVAGLHGSSNQPAEEREQLGADIGEALSMDLPTRFKQRLRRPQDALAEDLVAGAKAIRLFLDGPSTGLPWAPQLNNAAGNKEIIEDLEERSREVQLATATIVLSDHEGDYAPALLRAVKILAKATDMPNGVTYNRIGESIRYYPLGLLLYTIFICAVAANRGSLLKEMIELPLKRQERGSPSHITDIFFHWYAAKAFFNDGFGQRWCEPIGQRIRQILSDRLGEMFTEFSEPEWFFRGEFVLALARIDATMTNDTGTVDTEPVPVPGLYLYAHEAPESIAGLLLEYPDWLDHIYAHPLGDIIAVFDRNAHKVIDPRCIPLGLQRVNTSDAYQKALRLKKKT